MKKIMILLAGLLVSCQEPIKFSDIKKSQKTNMDLGMMLYKNKLAIFEGNEIKADSAYQAEKNIMIDELYSNYDK